MPASQWRTNTKTARNNSIKVPPVKSSKEVKVREVGRNLKRESKSVYYYTQYTVRVDQPSLSQYTNSFTLHYTQPLDRRLKNFKFIFRISIKYFTSLTTPSVMSLLLTSCWGPFYTVLGNRSSASVAVDRQVSKGRRIRCRATENNKPRDQKKRKKCKPLLSSR